MTNARTDTRTATVRTAPDTCDICSPEPCRQHEPESLTPLEAWKQGLITFGERVEIEKRADLRARNAAAEKLGRKPKVTFGKVEFGMFDDEKEFTVFVEGQDVGQATMTLDTAEDPIESPAYLFYANERAPRWMQGLEFGAGHTTKAAMAKDIKTEIVEAWMQSMLIEQEDMDPKNPAPDTGAGPGGEEA